MLISLWNVTENMYNIKKYPKSKIIPRNIPKFPRFYLCTFHLLSSLRNIFWHISVALIGANFFLLFACVIKQMAMCCVFFSLRLFNCMMFGSRRRIVEKMEGKSRVFLILVQHGTYNKMM